MSRTEGLSSKMRLDFRRHVPLAARLDAGQRYCILLETSGESREDFDLWQGLHDTRRERSGLEFSVAVFSDKALAKSFLDSTRHAKCDTVLEAVEYKGQQQGDERVYELMPVAVPRAVERKVVWN